jgi:type IV pilus assembly protein PilM
MKKDFSEVLKSLPQKLQSLKSVAADLQLRLGGKKPRRLLSVDFGQACVKIVYTETQEAAFKLLKYAVKRIAGKDKKSEIANFINDFVRLKSIRESDVALTISDPDAVIVKHIELPALPKSEILEAAKWQLKEEIPFALEEGLIDFQIVREFTDEQGARRNRIAFIVARRRTIDEYISVVRTCNLNPVKVSHPPFDYGNILSLHPESASISAVLDIGYSEASIYIYQNNQLQFIRKLPCGSDRLTRSLTAALISDKGRIELSYAQAEDIKISFGIPQDSDRILKDRIHAGQIVSLMRPFMETLVTELKRTFDYFRAKFDKDSTMLYLTGGGANLKNLDTYLSKELNMPVSRLAIPDAVDTRGNLLAELETDQNQLISALGAALPGVRTVNLLPPEIRAEKVQLIEKVSLRLTAITAAAVFLFLLSVVNFQARDYKKRLSNARTHLGNIGQLKSLTQGVIAYNNLIATVRQGRVPAAGLLKVVANLVPEDITLNELILNQESHNLNLKGAVSMHGGAAEDVLTRFMEDIENSTFFTEARLISLNQTEQNWTFEIDCELVY